MADVTAGAARYASVAEVRADVERAGGDASVLCGFGRCFCVKTALGISGRKERGHWAPQCQEAEGLYSPQQQSLTTRTTGD